MGTRQGFSSNSVREIVSPRGVTGRKPATKSVEAPANQVKDWRDETLSNLRNLILAADPYAVEQVKWRKPTNPDGVPVWSHDGIICIANVLKRAVRLTFPHGAQIRDPKKLFNTRLDSKTVRAIDVHESESVDEEGLKRIIREAAALNVSKAKER